MATEALAKPGLFHWLIVIQLFLEAVEDDLREQLLYVSRRPQFYTWVLLIPTFVITTVSIFGLFIPTNSLGDREEKVNLGLTTLLSSAVILEIVANSMPKASALPLLGNDDL
ncbi:hypothetical protein COOONC_18400 [Cooperia oncophora]